MFIIYYIVSGGMMEILQFILTLLKDDKALDAIKPILSLLSSNSFDLKNVLSNLSIEKLAPLISLFMESANKNKSPTVSVGQGVQLNPISSIADKDIVACLNEYFLYA